MTRCSFGLHKWGRWKYEKVDYDEWTSFKGIPISERRPVVLKIGTRSCDLCGKEERTREKA